MWLDGGPGGAGGTGEGDGDWHVNTSQ